MKQVYYILFLVVIIFGMLNPSLLMGSSVGKDKESAVFTAADLLRTKRLSEVKISPDGHWIAYTIQVQRRSTEKAGSAYRKLYLMSLKTKQSRPFVTGHVSVANIKWHPQSSHLGYIRKNRDGKRQVWIIPVDGGEGIPVTDSKTGVRDFEWFPGGKQIAFTAVEAPSKRDKKLKKLGYGFVFFEEKIPHVHLYRTSIERNHRVRKVIQLTNDVSVYRFQISPDGKSIAAAVAKKNLIDHQYMFTKIKLIDLTSGKLQPMSGNAGKLGSFRFSPDGRHLLYTAALDQSDHAVSQLFVRGIGDKKSINLTISDFRGHIDWGIWKSNRLIYYHAKEGMQTVLRSVTLDGKKRGIVKNSKQDGIIFGQISFSRNRQLAAFAGQSSEDPSNLYLISFQKKGKSSRKLSNINPWIIGKTLGQQTIMRYKVDDGLEIEGLLIYPVAYRKGQRYPLIVIVHGGPESNYSNGWVTRYSEPGQVLAGKGYAVFYPNYRASTGYGVPFAAEGLGDPAGKEFDDIRDGIRVLQERGIADLKRVGLAGGSYGGYAAAWFSSYYTQYVKAVCMFVGISDLISKRGTTDIPYEELYVHSKLKLEESWEISLKRSPIYHAHRSKTAVLILGGKSDTRVHPIQSIEYFRRLKMNHHPAVRLVQYPGEGHGNRKQPGRIDVLYRTLDWFDWYVRDDKALKGPLPPLDISEKYGLAMDK